MSDSGTPDVAPPEPVDSVELPEVMGLKAVSVATGIAMTTLKRKWLPELVRLGATKREDGQGYAIPLEAVKQLRLFDQVQGEYGTRRASPARAVSSDDAPAPRSAPGTGGTYGTLPPGALDAEQAAQLRDELKESRERENAAREREAAARERAAAAEAVANERARTLQMLENGYTRQLESSQETIRLLEAKVPAPESPRRRGWFGRNSAPE